jgi:hypothetical protein
MHTVLRFNGFLVLYSNCRSTPNGAVTVINTWFVVELAVLWYTKLPRGIARSKAWVYGPSLAGIVGSNPAGGMDVCLL